MSTILVSEDEKKIRKCIGILKFNTDKTTRSKPWPARAAKVITDDHEKVTMAFLRQLDRWS